MKFNNIYTISYKNKTPAQFKSILKRHNITILIDIMQSKVRQPKYIRELPEYQDWSKLLAPTKEMRKNGYDLIDYWLLLDNQRKAYELIPDLWLNNNINICFLCACPDYHYCHRYFMALYMNTIDDEIIFKIKNL